MAVNIGEAIISTLISKRQLAVIDSELVKNSSLKVVNVNHSGYEFVL
jgi:hypothetical protein